jgi:hypothetical protein
MCKAPWEFPGGFFYLTWHIIFLSVTGFSGGYVETAYKSEYSASSVQKKQEIRHTWTCFFLRD